jgi:tetratricopeptide (TPR) repeat protein
VASRAVELLATAQEALAAGAYDGALSAAIASLDENEDLARCHRTLGDLYSIDDRYAEAQREWELAFRKLRDEGAWREAALVAIELARLHANMFGHPSAGAGWAERARLLLERLGPCVEWGYLELAYMACERPDTGDLLAAAERALTIALEHGDSSLEAQALADSGLALLREMVGDGLRACSLLVLLVEVYLSRDALDDAGGSGTTRRPTCCSPAISSPRPETARRSPATTSSSPRSERKRSSTAPPCPPTWCRRWSGWRSSSPPRWP